MYEDMPEPYTRDDRIDDDIDRWLGEINFFLGEYQVKDDTVIWSRIKEMYERCCAEPDQLEKWALLRNLEARRLK